MFVGMGANSGGAYNLESSLRFRSSASAYLERTPDTAGNRKKYTISIWVKKGLLGAGGKIVQQREDANGSQQFALSFSGDALRVLGQPGTGGSDILLDTTSVYRDPSAWYHIVVAMDTTQGTASDRTKLYVNGEQVTSFSSTTYPTLNLDTAYNNNVRTLIGCQRPNSSSTLNDFFDGYMTEFNSVDGQALTADDFGEYDDTTGVWKPKAYTGTYGTNGFYLPMKETQQATGFNTVLYTATGTDNLKVEGVGFSPDFVWIKSRDGARSHMLYDTVRGATNRLASESTASELSISDGLKSFDTNGFTLGTHSNNNTSGEKNVAWCWDAGSSTVSNTDGTITSSVRANPASGFSVVTYTGTGSSSATIGHGLGTTPSMIIARSRSSTQNWRVYHSSFGTTTSNTLYLNLQNAVSTTDSERISVVASDTFTVTQTTGGALNASGQNYVAYCFSEVAGFSKIGSFTGNATVGNSVTGLGFKPAWIMFKNANDGGESWYILDNTRSVNNTRYHKLNPDGSSAESTSTVNNLVDFDDDGFTIQSTNAGLNGSGNTIIYMAFADTRDAQFNFDASGNKNNWTANNINSNASSETTYDIMNDVATLTDEDTANFATLNPLDMGSLFPTVSEANLKFGVSGNSWTAIRATIGVSSGKWYWEITPLTAPSTNWFMNGIKDVTESIPAGTSQYIGYTSGSYAYYGLDGRKFNNATAVSYGAAYGVGDTIGVALDMDAGTLTFYKNNVSQGVAYSGLTGTFAPGLSLVGGTGTENTEAVNFGQRPFAYTPPTGYKKLNTYNLPDSTIVDGSQYINTVLWTGDATASRAITGVGFSPDLVWAKSRTNAYSSRLYDTIRGATKELYSAQTTAETTTTNSLLSFDSDGFTVGNVNSLNQSGSAIVAWNWRASDSTAVSNTDGTRTSTVSANTTSGFSVVTYTGNSTSGATVGHGLGTAPSMIITKTTNTSLGNWAVYHAGVGATKILYLNTTMAAVTGANWWNNTAPTSSVFTIGNSNDVNGPSNYVAYCFAEVEGFSKISYYIGNGSADGPFVYTGFRPAFVMFKRVDSTSNWIIFDQERGLYNLNDNYLYANSSGAEGTSASSGVDLLSNGFKQRNTYADANISGGTYIYIAFAENPFKQSLAR